MMLDTLGWYFNIIIVEEILETLAPRLEWAVPYRVQNHFSNGFLPFSSQNYAFIVQYMTYKFFTQL